MIRYDREAGLMNVALACGRGEMVELQGREGGLCCINGTYEWCARLVCGREWIETGRMESCFVQARTRGPTSSLPAAWCPSVMGRRTTRTTTRVTVRAQIGPFVSWASTF